MSSSALDAPSNASVVPPAVQAIPDTYPGWAYVAMLVGYPLAWMAGLGPAIWLAAAWPMLLWLTRRRSTLRIPDGFILWVLFLMMAGASVVQVNSAGRAATYLLRTGWYVAAGVTLLYLVNQPTVRMIRLIVKSLIFLWFVGVLFGYAAMLFPRFGWSGPIGSFLPGVITSNDFVSDLINPRLAEVQNFGSLTLGRPAAPYPYTNSWGSTFAVLVPFVLAVVQDKRMGFPRPVLLGMLAVSIPPFIVALNRGAWLTLGVGLIYGFVRFARKRQSWKIVKGLAVLLAIGLVLAVVTGLAGSVRGQLDTRSEDSNEARLSIYTETIDAVSDSPIIGYGTPRENPENPDQAPLGTHGQLWFVLFSHGFIAAAMFTLFFVQAFLRYTADTVVAHWAKVALFIGLIQLPIYGHLPQQLFILMSAVAVLSISESLPEGALTKLQRRAAR